MTGGVRSLYGTTHQKLHSSWNSLTGTVISPSSSSITTTLQRTEPILGLELLQGVGGSAVGVGGYGVGVVQPRVGVGSGFGVGGSGVGFSHEATHQKLHSSLGSLTSTIVPSALLPFTTTCHL